MKFHPQDDIYHLVDGNKVYIIFSEADHQSESEHIGFDLYFGEIL